MPDSPDVIEIETLVDPDVIEVGLRGEPALQGSGNISADPGNALTEGSDAGLYVPDDIPSDPLAYYILARS